MSIYDDYLNYTYFTAKIVENIYRMVLFIQSHFLRQLKWRKNAEM